MRFLGLGLDRWRLRLVVAGIMSVVAVALTWFRRLWDPKTLNSVIFMWQVGKA